MHNVHRPHAQYAYQRSPDRHTTHGPTGGRPRIILQTNETSQPTQPRRSRGPLGGGPSLHFQPGLTARLSAKNHTSPTGGLAVSIPYRPRATDPDFGNCAQGDSGTGYRKPAALETYPWPCAKTQATHRFSGLSLSPLPSDTRGRNNRIRGALYDLARLIRRPALGSAPGTAPAHLVGSVGSADPKGAPGTGVVNVFDFVDSVDFVDFVDFDRRQAQGSSMSSTL